jgi:hypothetical protein
MAGYRMENCYSYLPVLSEQFYGAKDGPLGAISLGLEQLECTAEHLLPSGAEIMNVGGGCKPTEPMHFLSCFSKHRNFFIFFTIS